MAESAAGEHPVLIVDQNEEDVSLVRRAFERAGLGHNIQSVGTETEAVAYLSGDSPYTDRLKYPLPGAGRRCALRSPFPATAPGHPPHWSRRPRSSLCC